MLMKTSADVKRRYTPGSLLCSMQEVKSEQDGGWVRGQGNFNDRHGV